MIQREISPRFLLMLKSTPRPFLRNCIHGKRPGCLRSIIPSQQSPTLVDVLKSGNFPLENITSPSGMNGVGI